MSNEAAHPRGESLRVTAQIGLCLVPAVLSSTFLVSHLFAQDTRFHNAPASSRQQKNPYAGQTAAVSAGARLYALNCRSCHGINGRGTGNIPPLSRGAVQTAPDGEVFWFITKGSVDNGMPSWASLSEQKRWQIVSYIKSLKNSQPAKTDAAPPPSSTAAPTRAPAPAPAFTDFRFEQPGKIHKITVQDLPAPYATRSASNGPDLVARPSNAWPKAPEGFSVQQFATGLENPRALRTAPNGDIFLAESSSGTIKVFRGITSDGKAQQSAIFASGLNQPYGIAFYPPGDNPQWVYIGNTDSVVRFPYHSGSLKADGVAQHIADLPHAEGHWTRDSILPRRQKDVRCSRIGIECR
jgi:mono/diheme cytochrome c family protein